MSGERDWLLAEVLHDVAEEIEATSRAAGWYDQARSFGEGIALLHSEVSEAFEAYRDHGLKDVTQHPTNGTTGALIPTEALPKPEGVGSEFADVFIRLLDESSRQGIDLATEVRRKINYNKTRGYRHGGKKV